MMTILTTKAESLIMNLHIDWHFNVLVHYNNNQQSNIYLANEKDDSWFVLCCKLTIRNIGLYVNVSYEFDLNITVTSLFIICERREILILYEIYCKHLIYIRKYDCIQWNSPFFYLLISTWCPELIGKGTWEHF